MYCQHYTSRATQNGQGALVSCWIWTHCLLTATRSNDHKFLLIYAKKKSLGYHTQITNFWYPSNWPLIENAYRKLDLNNRHFSLQKLVIWICLLIRCPLFRFWSFIFWGILKNFNFFSINFFRHLFMLTTWSIEHFNYKKTLVSLRWWFYLKKHFWFKHIKFNN